jgi:hypothetical protein
VKKTTFLGCVVCNSNSIRSTDLKLYGCFTQGVNMCTWVFSSPKININGVMGLDYMKKTAFLTKRQRGHLCPMDTFSSLTRLSIDVVPDQMQSHVLLDLEPIWLTSYTCFASDLCQKSLDPYNLTSYVNSEMPRHLILIQTVHKQMAVCLKAYALVGCIKNSIK